MTDKLWDKISIYEELRKHLKPKHIHLLDALVGELTDNQPKAIDESIKDDLDLLRFIATEKHQGLVDRIEQALTQLGEWRTIDSAPRTSRAILVHCMGRHNTYCVSWGQANGFMRNMCWKHFGSNGDLQEVPTHWMPLPSPPQAHEE